jgi:hypothetical protein
MKRLFEIYVAGSNGFSAYVSTTKPIVDLEEDVLSLAVAAKVIEAGDAKEVYHGAGYVEELQAADLHPATVITEI